MPDTTCPAAIRRLLDTGLRLDAGEIAQLEAYRDEIEAEREWLDRRIALAHRLNENEERRREAEHGRRDPSCAALPGMLR